MRNFTLIALTSTALLSACGEGAPPTTDQLLIGEWDQVDPVTVTQNGQSMTMSAGEMDFEANGTTESEGVLNFDGQPQAVAAYRLEGTGTYTLSGTTISQTLNAIDVVPVDDNPQSQQMAQGLANMMGAVGTSTLEIVRIDDDMLELRDPTTGVTTLYQRD